MTSPIWQLNATNQNAVTIRCIRFMIELNFRTPSMVNMRPIWMFLLFQRSCFALKPPPPLNVVPITAGNSSVLGNLNNTIGLQGALNKYYRSTNGAVTVFVDACMQDDGVKDCTVACQNLTQMFRNLTTLHNCVVFADISLHRSNNSLTTEASHLAEELNIEPGNNGSGIFNATQSCLLDSCNNNTDCAGKFNNTTNDTYISLCGAIPHNITADVGGIGVRSRSAPISMYVDIFTRCSYLTLCKWDSLCSHSFLPFLGLQSSGEFAPALFMFFALHRYRVSLAGPSTPRVIGNPSRLFEKR